MQNMKIIRKGKIGYALHNYKLEFRFCKRRYKENEFKKDNKESLITVPFLILFD